MPNTTTAAWPTLTAGRVARASDVESKFDYAEHSLWPHSTGTRVDNAFDLGDTTTAAWRSVYTYSINATSTARGLAIGTMTVANNSSTALEVSGTRAVLLPRLSTVQMTALTAADGMIAFNTTTSQLQVYRNGAWTNIGGTVYRNLGVTNVSAAAAATTTVINVASGGGKIHGLSWLNLSTLARLNNLQVILDGNIVISTTGADHTTGVGGGYLDGSGKLVSFTTSAGILTNTSGQTIGRVNSALLASGEFNFASTAVVYVSGVGGETTSVSLVLSVIQ